VSWVERNGARVALDESLLTSAAVLRPADPVSPAAATVALRAVGRHLDGQVLAGATQDQLAATLAVMRGIHLQVMGERKATASQTAARRDVAAQQRVAPGPTDANRQPLAGRGGLAGVRFP
jgi:hypothetical protein